jgi:hypothetical protein
MSDTTTRRPFQLGTVSHGTMRPQDLLPIFVSTIDSLNGDQPSTSYLGFSDDLPDDHMYWQSEEAGWDMEALFDALQNCSPPFVYFGAHEGDGSDFGFWPDTESLNEELRVNGLPHLDEPEFVDLEEYNIIVHVNDHGNVTVYDDMSNIVLWSCV